MELVYVADSLEKKRIGVFDDLKIVYANYIMKSAFGMFYLLKEIILYCYIIYTVNTLYCSV